MKVAEYDVLLVSRVLPAEARYGLGKGVTLLGQALQESGLRVLCLSPADLPPAWIDQAERWAARINRWAGRCFIAYRDLGLIRQICHCVALGRYACEEARRRGIGVIHVHDVGIAWGVLQARKRGDKLRCGLTQHSFDSTTHAIHHHVQPLPSWLRRLGAALERRVLTRLDWVVFLSQASRRDTAAQLGCRVGERWQVLPHPLPPMAFPPRTTARAALGWNDEERVLVAVGQLIPMKGFDRLIAACADYPGSLRLLLLGEGNVYPLSVLAAGLGVRCDFTVSDDIASYLAAADLYVSASLTESYGFANVEAMLAGLPVVATAVAAVPEVLSGSDAILVAPEPAALRRGIEQALAADPAGLTPVRERWLKAQPTAAMVAAQHRQWYGLS
ncbi:glycosyltransferase family 4 protein [Chitinimonas lacunae]|uniref:Glycosyltransferase family 4 protein n=1 Tax=Chitinimonas lacunae TaxID=1963018 RepID=A0ABV8MXW7_9NEIS